MKQLDRESLAALGGRGTICARNRESRIITTPIFIHKQETVSKRICVNLKYDLKSRSIQLI